MQLHPIIGNLIFFFVASHIALTYIYDKSESYLALSMQMANGFKKKKKKRNNRITIENKITKKKTKLVKVCHFILHDKIVMRV